MRIRVDWRIAIAAGLISSACGRPADLELPSACSTVTRPNAGDLPDFPRQSPGASPVFDTLFAWIREKPWDAKGKPYSALLARRDSVWEVDSVTVGIALSQIILEGGGYESIVAGSWYNDVSGRSEPLLRVFLKYAEPMDRVPWVLNALKPPLDSASERQVFGYACDAAWKLLQLKNDPYIESREALGHGVFRVTSLQGILLSAEDLITGPLHAEVVALFQVTGQDSLLR